jgi:hypothetical protein
LAESFDLPWSAKPEDQPNQAMAAIHGGMPDVWLAKTIEAFGTGNAAIRLLIATDVASEGVNLHHQCWHIIHYDLPWSIITLIQRNGRIDRFGQHHVPEIRYLMVLTEVGELKGDQAIFGRLVEKVEEINRTARSGESVLKLYDAEREEEFVAEKGLLGGNKDILDPPEADRPESSDVEDMLRQASEQAMAELSDLFDDDDKISIREPAEKIGDTSRVRLYDNVRFLEEGFSLLSQMSGDASYHPIEKTPRQFLLTPPSDLRRRLGAPEAGRDIVFGATAIPEEAWPEDGRLRLTTDPDRVDTAIRAARALRGQWSDELLLTELHPVMRWLAERLMMLMPRGEAPMIASPYLPEGEMCFCFIGQVSSRAGTPIIADAHAVFIAKGGRIDLLPLKEALERARFDDLADTGRRGTMPEPLLRGFVTAAVNQSLDRMQTRKQERQTELRPLLEKEESRLKNWLARRRDRINDQLADLSPTSQQAVRARQSLEEAEKYVQDRNLNWRLAHFEAADQPTTRLILAIEGVR